MAAKSAMCVCICECACIKRETLGYFLKDLESGLGAKSFPFNFVIRPIKWKYHFIKVDLYQLKGLKIKNEVF